MICFEYFRYFIRVVHFAQLQCVFVFINDYYVIVLCNKTPIEVKLFCTFLSYTLKGGFLHHKLYFWFPKETFNEQ